MFIDTELCDTDLAQIALGPRCGRVPFKMCHMGDHGADSQWALLHSPHQVGPPGFEARKW